MKETEEPREMPTGLGVAITVLRTRRGLAQKELARRAGVKPGTASAWESGGSEPGTGNFERLAGAFAIAPPTLEALANLFGSIPVLLGQPGEGGQAAAAAVRMAVLLTRAGDALFTEHPEEPAPTAGAQELWERLSRYGTPAERQAVVCEVEDFWTGPFCELLRGESRKAASADPGRALELADLALTVAHLASGINREALD